MAIFEKALSSSLKTLVENHLDVATRMYNLGMVWNKLGGYEKGTGYLEKAYVSFKKRLGDHHPNTLMVKRSLDKARQKFIVGQSSFVKPSRYPMWKYLEVLTNESFK